MEHNYSRVLVHVPGEKSSRQPKELRSEHSYACNINAPKKRPLSSIDENSSTLSPKVCLVGKSSAKAFPRWTNDEILFLKTYVFENADSLKSNGFWKECAAKLHSQFSENSLRSADSCRRAYERLPTPHFPRQKEIGVQTDLSLQCDHKVSFDEDRYNCQTTKDIPTGLTRGGSCLFYHDFTKNSHLDLEETIVSDKTKSDMIAAIFSDDVSSLIRHIMSSKCLKAKLWNAFLCNVDSCATDMCERRASYLYSKDFNDLAHFDMDSLVEEVCTTNPYLTDVLLATASRKNWMGQSYNSFVPKVGLIYSILMSTKFHELSRMKRVMSLSLAHCQAHQKVYDILQPTGVCLSHSRLVSVMDVVQGHFNSELISSVKEGRRFRLVGDNINFCIKVTHERKSRRQRQHMEHWFGSAAVVQNICFNHLGNISPQRDLLKLPVDHFLMSLSDLDLLKKDYAVLLGRVLVSFVPEFSFLKSAVNKDIEGEFYRQLSEKNKVIPRPALAKNEQKYADDVDILDEYQTIVSDVFKAAEVPVQNVHIGGDQLTRERLSGAKRLRAITSTPAEQFRNLTPITFELFHLQINLLTLFYHLLYKTQSSEAGTLHAAKILLSRENADGTDVKNHYNDCFELAMSVTDAYIVEAFQHFFRTDNQHIEIQDRPNKISEEDKLEWLRNKMNPMIEEMVVDEAVSFISSIEDIHTYIPVVLPDGTQTFLRVTNPNPQRTSAEANMNEDLVGNYAHTVLEIGMLLKELADIIKVPDRKRLLACLKYILLIMKSHNTRSKYALEILRFIVHQTATLSERIATEACYGLFVNTKGKANSHIPVDLQMEYLVRLSKSHLKSMCSNKSEKSIEKRTAAFYGMESVYENMARVSSICVRAHRHKRPSSTEDEGLIIAALRRLRPFDSQPGRLFDSIPRIKRSPLCKLDKANLEKWICDHQVKLKYELGQ